MPGGAAGDVPVCPDLGTARVVAIEKKRKKIPKLSIDDVQEPVAFTRLHQKRKKSVAEFFPLIAEQTLKGVTHARRCAET